MNDFKKVSQHYFTPEQIRKIENTKVCIAGCGGLGSNIAHMLVRCGFRKFVLIDYDLVEEKNLNRQFFFPDQAGLLKTDALVQNLHMINHDLATETITDKFESFRDIKDRVKDCHIFIEAFDYGAPPHCGVGIGIERLIMILSGTDNIKDVVAFPKTATAYDLMADAPSTVDQDHLDFLSLQIRKD